MILSVPGYRVLYLMEAKKKDEFESQENQKKENNSSSISLSNSSTEA